MEVKLTLKLDEQVIQLAKLYAKSSKQSVSGLVEDFFRNLAVQPSPSPKYSPLVEELSGVVPVSAATESYYVDYLEKKYE